MKIGLTTKILSVLLVLSLAANGYFFATRDTQLKKDAFCAQYKEQAAKRVSTYYTNGDILNIYPSEIFYSKSRQACIAIWTDIETNPAGNGYSENRAIFDPITNDELYSANLVHFYNSKDNTELEKINKNRDEQYSKLRLELKGQ